MWHVTCIPRAFQQLGSTDVTTVCDSPYRYDVRWHLPWWLCWWCGGPGTELGLLSLWGLRLDDSVSPLQWWLSWAHWAATPSPQHRCLGWWYKCLHQNTWNRHTEERWWKLGEWDRGDRQRCEWASWPCWPWSGFPLYYNSCFVTLHSNAEQGFEGINASTQPGPLSDPALMDQIRGCAKLLSNIPYSHHVFSVLQVKKCQQWATLEKVCVTDILFKSNFTSFFFYLFPQGKLANLWLVIYSHFRYTG